jgi:hypothetical protein
LGARLGATTVPASRSGYRRGVAWSEERFRHPLRHSGIAILAHGGLMIIKDVGHGAA